jgi:hypothetical protein
MQHDQVMTIQLQKQKIKKIQLIVNKTQLTIKIQQQKKKDNYQELAEQKKIQVKM